MNNNASPCKPSECPHRPRSSRTRAQSTPGPGRGHWVPGQCSHSPRSFSQNHQSLRLSKHPPAFVRILVCGKVLTSSAKILLRGGETQKTGSWRGPRVRRVEMWAGNGPRGPGQVDGGIFQSRSIYLRIKACHTWCYLNHQHWDNCHFVLVKSVDVN